MATFGYNSNGDTTHGAISIGGSAFGSKFTAPENGNITNIHVYFDNIFFQAIDAKVAIYDASDDSLLYAGGVYSVGATEDRWHDISITSTAITGSGVY